jgi:hypothetical protein
MSICINNDLIWISIPRCASTSIENSLQNTENLDIKYPGTYERFFFKKGLHVHLRLKTMYNFFGKKETICITRNWFDRWLSGLEHMWWEMISSKNFPVIPWEEIDNDWIYQNITSEYVNAIYTINRNVEKDDDIELWKVKEKWNNYFVMPEFIDQRRNRFFPTVLLSEKYWKENIKCTYEFDIKEIDKFESFISKRYNVDFKLLKLNSYEKLPNKIVKDEKLKNWVWNNFEKPFITTDKLI